MLLRAVLFDLWETLINDVPERSQPRRLWRTRAVRDVLLAHGRDIAEGDVLVSLDATTVALTRMHDTGRDTDSLGRAVLFAQELETRTGEAPPASAMAEIEDAITCMPLDMAPRLAEDAVETVATLKQRGLALALVCNAGFTTAPHLRVMLEHYGLLPHFDTLVFSDELRIAKPDARILSARRWTASPSRAAECAFIGDNPHTDISGAIAAGLFRRFSIGAKVRDGITPHARVDGLSELIGVLETAPASLIELTTPHLGRSRLDTPWVGG